MKDLASCEDDAHSKSRFQILQRVLRDGPWTFDKHLVLVKDFDGAQQTQMLYLTKASF